MSNVVIMTAPCGPTAQDRAVAMHELNAKIERIYAQRRPTSIDWWFYDHDQAIDVLRAMGVDLDAIDRAQEHLVANPTMDLMLAYFEVPDAPPD